MASAGERAEDGALVVVVTGCSSGIGKAVALLLARDEERRFRVYATMRNAQARRADLEAGAAGEAGGGGGAGEGVLGRTLFVEELDVTNDSDCQKVVDGILEKEGRIDVLVNNAGQLLWDALDTVPLERAREIFDINFWGYVKMMRAVMPSMKTRRTGRIINMSSMFGFDSPPFQTIYAASKFAVEGMTESMAPVLKLYNIWTILIQPALVSTAMTRDTADPVAFVTDTPREAGFDDVTTAAFRSRFASPGIRQLLGAMEAPDQVARVVRDAALSPEPHLRYQTSDVSKALAASRMVDTCGDDRFDLLKDQ